MPNKNSLYLSAMLSLRTKGFKFLRLEEMTTNTIIFSLHKRKIPEEEMLTLQFDSKIQRQHCLVKKKSLVAFMAKQSLSWTVRDIKLADNKLVLIC